MNEQTKNSGLKIALIFVSILLIVSVIFIVLQNNTTSETPQNQLTINSFISEISSDEFEIIENMELEIQDYRIENNNVKCEGKITWHTNEYIIGGWQISMTIKEYKKNSVDVRVFVHGGSLLLAKETIDSDSVTIPKLGEDKFSFDFLLTCSYE